ncbi:alpha-soluble NSF attachment protein-like [Paramacrobiotus metropolitanus]|uniref:alpha-soluble NSF attachment protein-like n=1 Tax=Paramacrobiotus metropolitanus TaxID=2943436 RepID=UPI002445CC02|nr:alpha-soluble NSF attachment protein-like [Paramacrobiotus metropolitanus]
MTAPVAQNLHCDTAPDEARARALLTAARSAVAWGNMLEASRLFHRAGNFFKMDQKWHDAGAAFQTAAELKMPFEADTIPAPPYTTEVRKITSSGLLKTASDCFVKAQDFRVAVSCLQTAADLLAEDGDFTTAAGHCKALAQMLAPRDVDGAIRFYEKAARLHEAAADVHGRSAGDKAWLTVGEQLARKGDYTAAIDLFEGLADRILQEPKARDYASSGGVYVPDFSTAEPKCLTRAVLCYLCRDGPSAAQEAVVRWDAKLPSSGFMFDQERNVLRQVMGGAENRFTAGHIAKILQAPENAGSATASGPPWCDNDTQTRRLDKWTTMMLERALQMLRDAENKAQR